MTITLRIENFDQLADGGPVQYQASGRSFDIGREQHLDWSLPDPNRVISGRHCEVRFEKGAYMLFDVSRNGTFLNNAGARMKSPHRLENGDRLQIGHYLISVAIPEAASRDYDEAPTASAPSLGGESIWDLGGSAPAPVDRRAFMPPQARGQRAPDFSEQYIDLPEMRPQPTPRPAAPAQSPFADVRPPAPPPFAQPQMPAASPFGQAPATSPFQPAASPFGQPARENAARSDEFPPLGESPFAPVPAPALPPLPPIRQPAPLPAMSPELRPRPMAPSEPAPRRAEPAFAPPPEPVQPPPQFSRPPPPAPSGPSAAGFLRAFAAGAGVAPETFDQRNPEELGHEVGVVLKIVLEQLSVLLKARAAAKVMTKSSNRTMISAEHNNPLKFIPGTSEIIEVMFARRRPGYLDAQGSVEQAFSDLKSHEIATFSAMQKALAKLLDGLSPQSIETKLPSSTFSSKKARAWDMFVERWDAKTDPYENGMLDVFLAYFAEAYDEAAKKR